MTGKMQPPPPVYEKEKVDSDTSFAPEMKNKPKGQRKVHPFRLLAGLVVFSVFWGIGSTVFAGQNQNVYTSSEAIDYGYAVENAVNLQTVNSFITDDGQYVITAKIEKLDPDTEVNGMSATAYTSVSPEDWEFISVPSLGFDQQEAYFSAIFDLGVSQDADVEGTIEFSDEGVWVEHLSDWSWGENLSRQEMLEQLKESGYLNSNMVRIDGDPAENQSDQIYVTISSDEQGTQWIYQTVNLVFYQNGEVVFADTMECNASGKKGSYQFVYNLPIDIPGGYDEVRVTSVGI